MKLVHHNKERKVSQLNRGGLRRVPGSCGNCGDKESMAA